MKVVAKKYYLGLGPASAAITDDVVFTSTEGGDYLICLALACEAGNGTPTVSLSWTDALGIVKGFSNSDSTVAAYPANIPPSGSIQVSISPDSGSDTPPGTFNVYVTVADLAAPGL